MRADGGQQRVLARTEKMSVRSCINTLLSFAVVHQWMPSHFFVIADVDDAEWVSFRESPAAKLFPEPQVDVAELHT